MTDISANTETEVVVKKKRGRKPNPNKKNYYFGVDEEKAVVDYLSTDDINERNRIFNTKLKMPFTKMIESIIRRYNLYPPDEEFDETFDDTMSFLMMKLSCFDPTTNYKAYSYCGTICKNYLIYKINQFSKNQKRSESYDNPNDTVNVNDNIVFSYSESDPKSAFISELTGSTVENIKKILKDKDRLKLTENEIKVGTTLINLMNNWDDIFAQMGSNKFNKSSILLFLKETTLLNTKEIRDALKVYKKRYYEVKWKIINE
jgi:hypothetical protein